jgi:hypothetical protein
MLAALKRHKSSLLALGFFGLLTLVTLNDLILNFWTAAPNGPGSDYPTFTWDLWWTKYALLNLHTNPLFTNYILFPNTVNLTLHTHVFTLGLLSIPFQLFMDTLGVVNGLIVLSFLLSSTIMFVFLRRHVHNTWLCVLGATIYAFNLTTLGEGAKKTGLNVLAVWWLPLGLLLWDLTLERRSIRWALALGVCAYLTFMTYAELFIWMLATLPFYMLYGLFAQVNWRARLQVIGLGLVVAVTALAPALMIMPLPQQQRLDWNEYPREDLRTVRYNSLTFETLLTPSAEIERHLTLGQALPIMTLAALALTGKRRQRWLWLGIGLISLILALGPYIDDPSHPLPFMLLYHLFHGQYRSPARFTTPATLALAVFITWSLANLFDRLTNPRAQRVIVAVLIALYIADVGILTPFPIYTPPNYPVYRMIGADPEDHTLLQVPMGVVSGTRALSPGARLIYYARFHHQRTINGDVSRAPASQIARYERAPLVRALATLSPLPPFEEARADLVQRLKNWDIRYIVVHKDLLGDDKARPFIEFFNRQPELCVFDDRVETIAYRAISSWADCPRPDLTAPPSDGKVSMGEPTHDRFIGTGWYDVENIGGPVGRWAGEIPTSTLRVLLPRQNTRIRFRAAAFPANQILTISINGHTITTLKLINDWAEYELTVPGEALRVDGPSLITLTHTRLESAFQRTGGATLDQRPLAAAYDYFAFEPAH